MQRKIFISGVNGQDGAYLARDVINRGCVVFGGVRSCQNSNLTNLKNLGILDDVTLVDFDLAKSEDINKCINKILPDEFYNFAGLSSVNQSWKYPQLTFKVNATGVVRILEALRQANNNCRFFQAGSSEMFGCTKAGFQDEETPFHPNNPYGIAKLAAYHAVQSYRASYKIFAANGIMFNHESPLRPETNVSRKITRSLAKVSLGHADMLRIGNLDSKRDWGYAPEYVQGMFALLQNDVALDMVFATGHTHSVRDFINISARHLGIEIDWTGVGVDEVGVDKASGKTIVKTDPEFYRPSDILQTKGRADKARQALGWEAKVDIVELTKIMIEHDLATLANT